LRGQGFDVLQGGKERITIRLVDGMSMRIRRDWTDADGVDPSTKNAHERFFRVESLRELIELVDAFSRRQVDDAT